MLCREVIKQDSENVNVDKITQQVTPKARILVPDTVKKELLQKIKTILSNQEGVDMWIIIWKLEIEEYKIELKLFFYLSLHEEKIKYKKCNELKKNK